MSFPSVTTDLMHHSPGGLCRELVSVQPALQMLSPTDTFKE